MIQAIFLVAAAGAVGAVSRYLVGLGAVRVLGPQFPFGTLLVNILGCLFLGFLLEMEHNTTLVSQQTRIFLAVGFLGSFTTFSTFGHETFTHLNAGSVQVALLNMSANLVLGLAAVWLGWWVARSLFPVNI
jgi:fluoride exporter